MAIMLERQVVEICLVCGGVQWDTSRRDNPMVFLDVGCRLHCRESWEAARRQVGKDEWLWMEGVVEEGARFYVTLWPLGVQPPPERNWARGDR